MPPCQLFYKKKTVKRGKSSKLGGQPDCFSFQNDKQFKQNVDAARINLKNYYCD